MNFETVRFGFPVDPDEVDLCVDCEGEGEMVVPNHPPFGKYVRQIDGGRSVTCGGCEGHRIRDDFGEGAPVVPAESAEAAA